MNRDAFLARLADRLAHAAPPATIHPPGPPPETVPRVAWPPDDRPLEVRFKAALEAEHGRVASLGELPALLEELDVRSAVVTDDRIPLPEDVERLPLERAGEADASVTVALAGCATTGTVLIAPSPTESRLVSLLPRVHIVGVPRDQLVETPGDVLRHLDRWFPDGLPANFSLATGPSRSADIDGEVVYGVHGPLAVIAVLM